MYKRERKYKSALGDLEIVWTPDAKLSCIFDERDFGNRWRNLTNVLPTFFSHLENLLIYQLPFLRTIGDALN